MDQISGRIRKYYYFMAYHYSRIRQILPDIPGKEFEFPEFSVR